MNITPLKPIKIDHSIQPKFSYIGRKPCGCVMACVVDFGDKSTGKSVAEFIAEGLTIERVSMEQFRSEIVNSIGFMNCPHGQLKLEDALTLSEQDVEQRR